MKSTLTHVHVYSIGNLFEEELINDLFYNWDAGFTASPSPLAVVEENFYAIKSFTSISLWNVKKVVIFHLYGFLFVKETLPETNKANDHMKKFAMLLKDDKRMRHFVKTLVGSDCNSQKAQDLVVRHKSCLNKSKLLITFALEIHFYSRVRYFHDICKLIWLIFLISNYSSLFSMLGL